MDAELLPCPFCGGEAAFDQLPPEMQEAWRRLRVAVVRQRKAQAQSQAWYAELEAANKIHEAEQKAYGQVSLRWDVDKNVMITSLQEFKTPDPSAEDK